MRRYGLKADKAFGGYEDALFAQHVLRTVALHNTSQSYSYFLYWAPHIVHTPLQVPAVFFDKFSFMAADDKPTHERQTYHGTQPAPPQYSTVPVVLYRTMLTPYCDDDDDDDDDMMMMMMMI